jgi:hypothetical protein
MKLRILTITLSTIYCFYLAAVGIADLCFMCSHEITGEPLKYISIAKTLNPLNSDYYYRKFEILISGNMRMDKSTQIRNERISLIRKAIELEPTNSKYHMFYALDLLKQKGLSPKGTVPDFVIKQELQRAVSLKPFSKKYREILNQYSPYLK